MSTKPVADYKYSNKNLARLIRTYRIQKVRAGLSAGVAVLSLVLVASGPDEAFVMPNHSFMDWMDMISHTPAYWRIYLGASVAATALVATLYSVVAAFILSYRVRLFLIDKAVFDKYQVPVSSCSSERSSP